MSAVKYAIGPALLLACGVALSEPPVRAADEASAKAKSPLVLFGERLVGGYWSIQNGGSLGGYNLFTWGPNRQSIRGIFYGKGEGASAPVRAEGFFYWHPGDEALRGVSTGAGGELYDGKFEMSSDGWTQDFVHYAGGKKTEYREKWVFPDADTYEWTLYSRSSGQPAKVMALTFKRVDKQPGARERTGRGDDGSPVAYPGRLKVRLDLLSVQTRRGISRGRENCGVCAR